MTSSMYVALARIFNQAASDENIQVVLWHGAGDSFCAGNDIEDFLKNPPGPEDRREHAIPVTPIAVVEDFPGRPASCRTARVQTRSDCP
jgi:enoyl-CoA hydratase/carnithine racemase